MKYQVMQADVIIVGGSIGGMSAAIKIKEENPALSVLVVEKYFSGYAGKANRGGGIMICLDGKATPEEFVAYHTKNIGGYLNDQERLLDYASKLDSGLEWLDKYSNGKLSRNPDNSFATGEWGADYQGVDEQGKMILGVSKLPWRVAGIELDFLLEMKKNALKMGVKFVDRVGVVDLLTEDGTVKGCVGYHIENGEGYIFEGKAVLLVNGSQNYRIMPMWAPGRGEGIAAAWRAGAMMANPEYGSFCNWVNLGNYEAILGVEEALYNDKNENIGLQHRQSIHSDIDARTVAEWYQQMRDGNGPMHYHPQENRMLPTVSALFGETSPYNRPFADTFWYALHMNAMMNQKGDTVVPGLIGELSPVWVGKDFQTTIKGLFCAGDICYTATGTVGAVPAPPSRTRGGGLAFALYSACEAGITIAQYAAASTEIIPRGERCTTDIEHSFFAPLHRNSGIHPNDFLKEIHAVMGDIGNTICRSQDRMLKAIDAIDALDARLDTLKATDMHELFLCNEVKSMVLCAQLFFKTSVLREESRGWFYREDFESRNDANWLKWTTVSNDEGAFKIDYVDVPIASYPNQPD